MNKTLSVATYVSNPKSLEFYLRELINSVKPISDEIIVINMDQCKDDRSETSLLLCGYYDIVRTFHLPWQKRMMKNMGRIARSVAISQASCDYVLILDCDEVIHEKDHDKIKKCMEMDHDIYSFRTLHFYRDYNHIKYGVNTSDPGQVWYDHRPKMFKNNLGIFDMHDKNGNYSGLVTFNGEDCQTIAKKTSIEIFHYGHVRSKEVYVKKTNDIERSYHPDWKDIQVEDFEWNISGTKLFEGTHPKVMKKRIENHKKKYSQYY